jgi:predicted AAA+ superfamily ATPase
LVRERYLERVRPFYATTDLVKIITGLRRCGKSVLLGQIAAEIRQRDPSAQVVELNFELMDLRGIASPVDLEAHVLAQVDPAGGQAHVFLDEVQAVEEFELAVNSLRARGLSVFITGSNAHLLSDELATHLAGRHVQCRLWPLSYAESLELRGLEPGRPEILSDYLDWGGLPQRFALNPGLETRTYLRDVFDSVVLRDIVRRLGARSVAGLEAIIDFAQENLSRVLSPRSLANYLKAQGRPLATDTIYAYLGAMERSQLFQRLRRYQVRGKRVMDRLDKFYATDLGLLASKRVGSGPGPGDKLENAVCVELLARGFEVFTGSAKSAEIGFVAVKDGAPRYVQVAYLIPDQAVADREFGALAAVADNHPKFVVSADPLTRDRDGVRHLKIEDFLIAPPPELA